MKISHYRSKVLVFLVTPSLSLADPIGINFGAGRADAALDPTEVAGVIPQTNWNNLEGASGGPITLNDSSGAASSASISWNSAEQWSLGDAAVDPNGTLLKGWIATQALTDPPSSVTITGIPFTTYDLYIYLAHDRATEDVLISEENSAFPDFLAHEDDTLITAQVVFNQQTLTADGDATQSGNYIKFSSLSLADLNLFLDPAGAAGSGDRGAINGIQIIEVLEGDSDGDGLDDTWEVSFGLDPNDNGLNPNNNGVEGNPDNGADGDPDNDGSPNAEEQERSTFPNQDDTDNDGLLDGVETNDGNYIDASMTGTNPLRIDSDEDNLSDGVETNTGIFVDETNTGTNPNKADSDDDSLTDDWEITNNLDPFDDGSINPINGASGDPDNDGSDNANEQTLGTDPQLADTDGDTLLDGVETNDGNYLNDQSTGTDPLNADTDGDTLRDDYEDNSGNFVNPTNTGTDPNIFDTDGDFLADGWEIDNGRNPLNADDNNVAAGAIGLNFGAGRADASLLDTDSAGLAGQTNWNNLALTSGTDTALNDNSGAASGALVSWTVDEEWSAGGPGADANGTLLNGWISANNTGGGNTINISSIPYGSYDLVFYLNHDRGSEDILVSEANGAFTQVLLHENNPDILNLITFTQQVASAEGDATQVGNFYVVPNLTNTDLALVLDPGGEAGSADRGAITGIQIINRGGANELAITSITEDVDAGTVTITWNSVSGREYVIDAGPSPLLEETDEISDLTATGEISTYTESGIDFSANPKRFYRVREITNQ